MAGMPQPGEERSSEVGKIVSRITADRMMSVGIFAASAMVVSSFAPWGRALFVKVSGTDGTDGWITLACGAFAAYMLWRYARRPIRSAAVWASLAAIGGGLLFGWHLLDLQGGDEELFGEKVDLVDAGWGLYTGLISAVALLIASAGLARRSQVHQPKKGGGD